VHVCDPVDALYERLRSGEYDRRLEVSRHFVRVLVEQNSFTPQNEKHRIEVAERSALKLRELIRRQEADREYRESIRTSAAKATRETYDSKLGELRVTFAEAHDLGFDAELAQAAGKGDGSKSDAWVAFTCNRLLDEWMRKGG